MVPIWGRRSGGRKRRRSGRRSSVCGVICIELGAYFLTFQPGYK